MLRTFLATWLQYSIVTERIICFISGINGDTNLGFCGAGRIRSRFRARRGAGRADRRVDRRHRLSVRQLPGRVVGARRRLRALRGAAAEAASKKTDPGSEIWFPLNQVLEALDKLNRPQLEVRLGSDRIEQALNRLIEVLQQFE